MLAILSGLLRNPKDTVKIGYWSIFAIGMIYTVATLVFVLIFPSESAMRTPFPMYQLGKLIYLGRFFQRLEAAFVFIWVTLSVIKIALMIWVSTYLVASASRMPVNRPLVFPFVLIAYSLSFLPKSFPEMRNLVNLSSMWSPIILVGLPLATVLWIRITKKEGKTDDKAPQTS
jgi:hypothetical protein